MGHDYYYANDNRVNLKRKLGFYAVGISSSIDIKSALHYFSGENCKAKDINLNNIFLISSGLACKQLRENVPYSEVSFITPAYYGGNSVILLEDMIRVEGMDKMEDSYMGHFLLKPEFDSNA